MLVRYGRNRAGKRKKLAEIYTSKEHGIDKKFLDRDAVKICRRLNEAGFDTYIVGGAVRDLLIHKTPKDFDLCTSAKPRQIKKLFWNARIIGKRFRLVHIFYKDKIIEVSTFRALGDDNNTFGTIEEDVRRRDFSVNALYYCPKDEYVIDYVSGYRDLKARLIRPLISLKTIFEEDPVRMVRAIKYSATTNFRMTMRLKRKIKESASMIAGVSSSRITEELFKILHTGNSRKIFEMLNRFSLLKYFLPEIASRAFSKNTKKNKIKLLNRLFDLDKLITERPEGKDRRILFYLIADLIHIPYYERKLDGLIEYKECLKRAKGILRPMTPPNKDIEEALRSTYREKHIVIPRRPIYRPRHVVSK